MDKETKEYIDKAKITISNRIQETFDMVSLDVVNLQKRVKKLEDN